MRVTQSMITRNLVSNILESRKNMSDLEQTMATGKKIQKSSDDPVKFTMATRYRKTIKLNEMYLKNIVDARSWVSMTSGIVDDLYEHSLSAKEIALQAADASLNADIRENLTGKLDAIVDEMVSLLNTQYLGKYLFGGTKTKEEIPFSYDGSTISYNGDDGAITRRIAEGYDMTVNVPGSTFTDMGLIEKLIELRDALESNDTEAIRSSMAAIETNCNELLAVNSRLGSLKSQLTMTENRLEVSNTNLNSFISDLEDADLAEVITQYNAEELAYNAALQATANSFNLSILDYL